MRIPALLFILLLGISVLSPLSTAQQAASGPAPKPRPTSWTADNGNGTYSNPLFYEEFSDPDVIRVDKDYYLAGTTMHANPGLIVLHSKDLVNWELASYCIDRLDLAPAFHLDGGEIYGQGIWAPCIRYHNGMFYIYSNVNKFNTQLFRSKSPNGPWEHTRLSASLHDLSVLFDDDGKVWAVSGAKDIVLTQLNAEGTDVVPNTQHNIIKAAQGMGEGSHLYKIKGKYFIVSAQPGAHTDLVVGRADSLEGPWTVERMVTAESLGTPTPNGLRTIGRAPDVTYAATHPNPNDQGGLTIHQGGIVDTPSGQWWSVIMQDHGSVGRLSCLVPITWENNFPYIGLEGNLRKAPNTWLKPDTGVTQDPKPLFVRDDAFDGPKLNPLWQWNHAPDDTKWSLTEKAGVLRLHSLPAPDFWMARNSLTQRAIGPESVATVEIDSAGMKNGDMAGLALLSQPYAWIGLAKNSEGLALQTFDQSNRTGSGMKAPAAHLWLRASCNFDTEKATFSWSADGKTFTAFGTPFTMIYQLKTFQGIRYCLFNYNLNGMSSPGGYADFDNFKVDEPRAGGVERSINVGHLFFGSVADGTVLAVEGDSLVNVALVALNRGQPLPPPLLVTDRGLGRVTLQAADNRYLSVAPDGSVSLKALTADKLTDAETFQWVNLMQGHTMLMSLVNHKYLSTKPNAPGVVTATSTGPKPDRKEGSCFFTW